MFYGISERLGARILAVLICLSPVQGLAKPLLSNSQDTYATACLAFEESYDRLRDICLQALEQPGASQDQTLDIMDSLAWAYYRLDDDEAAEAVFRDILEINPQSEDGLTGLAWMAYDDSDYDTAADMFEQAMNRSPNAEVLAGLGASLFYADRATASEALTYLDAALAIDPDYIWALRRKGWVLTDSDQLSEAEAAFRTVLDHKADDASALYGVAYVLSEREKWAEALPFVTRAIEASPNYISALSRRSLILYYLDRPKRALKDADAVISARPDWHEGYVRKARVLASMGRRADALSLLEETDEKLGHNAFLVYWRARLLLDDGRNRDALTQIDRNLALDGADHFDNMLQVRIALRLEDVALARKAIDRTLKMRPKWHWVLYYDALVLVEEGKYEAAETRFDAAVDAGLTREKLPDFLKALIGQSQFTQAVRMRARYLTRD
ncbi:tetratricopeptide repeat protein [Arenibacterium sp. CAU 1754]